MSRWIGLWMGGSGYAHGDVPGDLEVFDSLAHARAALADRLRVGGHLKQRFRFLLPGHLTYTGEQPRTLEDDALWHERVYVPCVEDDCELWLWPLERGTGFDFDGQRMLAAGEVRERGEWAEERTGGPGDTYPDRRLFVGPRGAIRSERC